jgi:hypothetical protein
LQTSNASEAMGNKPSQFVLLNIVFVNRGYYLVRMESLIILVHIIYIMSIGMAIMLMANNVYFYIQHIYIYIYIYSLHSQSITAFVQFTSRTHLKN